VIIKSQNKSKKLGLINVIRINEVKTILKKITEILSGSAGGTENKRSRENLSSLSK
jgi:hypothetical protein